MSHHGSASPRDRLAWLVPGRTHVLVGGAGSGKTELCLRFIAAGLAAGERAAMLIASRGADVKAHASRLGLDLNDALRNDQLLLLRYRSDFAERLSQSATARAVVSDFERLVAPARPTRIVIDSFAPLLGDTPSGSTVIAALAAFLDRSGVTSLLTYPEDVSAGYDRRLEPLMQSAAAILRVDRQARDRFDLLTLTARGAGTGTGNGTADHTINSALPS